MLKKTPVALFVYNRLDHTKLTVDALVKNHGASDTDLVVFSDGPKTEADISKVQNLRSFLKSITGFRSVEIFESTANKGLASSIIDGVSYMIEKYQQVIVLEDDLVTSPHFLDYMNAGLQKYHDSQEVISIHGYMYDVKKSLPETFFLRGADCWGWATWKRGWDHFNKNGDELLKILEERNLCKKFDLNGNYGYTQMLKDQIAGKVSSWAIRWHASAFIADKLTLYPARSLVTNIGMDGSGTHCFEKTDYTTHLNTKPPVLAEIELKENKEALRAMEDFFAKQKPKASFRLIRKIKTLISSLHG